MGDGRGDDFYPRHHRIERGWEKVAAAGDRGSDYDNALPDGIRSNLAGEHRGSADRSDSLTGPVISERKRVVDVGGYRSIADHKTVRLDGGFLAGRQRRDAKRKRHFDPVAGSKQHRNGSGGATSIGGYIDDADLRMIGKSRARQQKPFGPRQPCERSIILRRDRLAGLRKYRRRRDHAGAA